MQGVISQQHEAVRKRKPAPCRGGKQGVQTLLEASSCPEFPSSRSCCCFPGTASAPSPVGEPCPAAGVAGKELVKLKSSGMQHDKRENNQQKKKKSETEKETSSSFLERTAGRLKLVGTAGTPATSPQRKQLPPECFQTAGDIPRQHSRGHASGTFHPKEQRWLDFGYGADLAEGSGS